MLNIEEPIYEVYFDTSDEYGTDTYKSIGKFIFSSDGTFFATGLYGEDEGSTFSGNWSIESDGTLKTTVTSINGDTLSNPTPSITSIESIEQTYIMTHWSDGSDSDINYYFKTLGEANSFGYTTEAEEE